MNGSDKPLSVQETFAHCAKRPEADLPLARTALLFARSEYPELDIEAYLACLDTIATDVHSQLPAKASNLDKLRALNHCLFQQRGFSGNETDYYDPRNSFLNDVLDRKLGIPITLSVVYLEVAWRLQLPLQGISFPGHFLVKLPLDDGLIVIDPFFRGITLDEDDLYERMKLLVDLGNVHELDLIDLLNATDKRGILIRLLRNLKTIYLQQDDLPRALNVCNHVLSLAPNSAPERRDRGLVLEQLECPQAALQDYQSYLQFTDKQTDTETIRERMRILQAKGFPRLN